MILLPRPERSNGVAVKALVTGAAGFIGSAISRALIARGDTVVGIDSMSDYYDESLKRGNLESIGCEGFIFYEEDLNNSPLSDRLDGIDYVFHEAGQPGVRKSWGDDFGIYVKANIAATQKLLEAARGANQLKKLVYASSSSVYGNAESYPTTEDMKPQPVSPYGVTKLAAEHLTTLYALNFGVPTVALRYFTVYGPGQRPDMAFTRFTRAAVVGDQITLFGTGEQIRDFTFIDDVVRANILSAESDVTSGTVFNVAGGSNVSMNEVVEILESLSGGTVKVNRTKAVPGDVLRTCGSTEKIAEQVGWRPTVPLEDGLERHYRWAEQTFGR